MIRNLIRGAIWDDRHPEPGPLVKLSKENIDKSLREHYARCQYSEQVNFTWSYSIRWLAWSLALFTSVFVVLAQGTSLAKLASAMPILSTALLGLEATEPFMARSGWNYTYKNKLERLILELLEDGDPHEVEKKRLDLKDEMGKVYPHWRISHSKDAPS